MRKVKPGIAFGDYIRTEKRIKHRASFDDPFSTSKIRDFFLILAFCLFFGILFIKLLDLQIFNGNYYLTLSDSNRIRTLIVHGPRGVIFDRNNVPLVFNKPGFRKNEKGKTKLIDYKDALNLIAKGAKDLEIDSLREYPYKDETAHILGYIGQISEEELKSNEFPTYASGELIGKMGIEKEYEKFLKGTDGKELIEVNSMGKSIRTLGKTDPVAGEDIKLTVDIKLQKAGFEALKDVKKGAVIVSTPKGEVLALLSKPSFDPNLFTLGEHYVADSQYKKISDVLLDSLSQPLLNRVVSGTYPPGSTFKIITAASGLENKIIDENFKITDTGILKIGDFSFSNWYYTKNGKTDGDINVVTAIKRSNDIFFYKLAEMIGVDKISQMARKFGLGSPLGIDLKGEAKGIVPDDSWKKKNIGEKWYLGDTYHYGIGQGYLLTTPLQVNGLTQVISNNGNLYQPHLIKESEGSLMSKNVLSQKTVGIIKQGMVEACSEGGVAWPLFDFSVKNKNLKIDNKNIFEAPKATQSADLADYRKVSIACKTGTAEHGGPNETPHAWITLFAPAYNPEIVVTVLVEDGGEGSNVAAPIAKKILEEYFKNKK